MYSQSYSVLQGGTVCLLSAHGGYSSQLLETRGGAGCGSAGWLTLLSNRGALIQSFGGSALPIRRGSPNQSLLHWRASATRAPGRSGRLERRDRAAAGGHTARHTHTHTEREREIPSRTLLSSIISARRRIKSRSLPSKSRKKTNEAFWNVFSWLRVVLSFRSVKLLNQIRDEWWHPSFELPSLWLGEAPSKPHSPHPDTTHPLPA